MNAEREINIALLAPYNVYPANTGGKKFNAFFYEYLQKKQPVLFISVPDNKMPAQFAQYFKPVLGNSKLRYANLFLFFKLKKLIRENKITDLIIIHPYFGWLGWLLKKATGVRLSVLSHNIESLRFKSMGKWWWGVLWQYEKKVHRISDHNFFVTEEDRQFALQHYKLQPKTCDVITYGTERKAIPSAEEKAIAAAMLRKQYSIGEAEKILFFNGSLDYLPNIEAVDFILKEINPRLIKANYAYRIIVCGKGLPAQYNELGDYKDKGIIYAGFVDDIDVVFRGADIFLNPVISGGGIKTKLVEALSNDLSSVSCETGAFGIPKELVEGKLSVLKDHDWDAFTDAIMKADTSVRTSDSFFGHFYWPNIAGKTLRILKAQQ